MITNVLFSQVNPAPTSPRNAPSLAGEITGLNNAMTAFQDSVIQGYITEGAAISYSSPNSFTINGNATTYYTSGRSLRLNVNGSAVYVIVESSSYNSGSGLTTVTVETSTVPNPLNQVDIAIQPKGNTNPNFFSPTIFTPTISSPIVTGGIFTKPTLKGRVVTIETPVDASTVTLDLSAGDFYIITLTENTTIALTNVSAGQPFFIKFIQGGSGSYTVTWFSTISWVNSQAPILTTIVGQADTFAFICTGNGTYDGTIWGQNIGT